MERGRRKMLTRSPHSWLMKTRWCKAASCLAIRSTPWIVFGGYIDRGWFAVEMNKGWPVSALVLVETPDFSWIFRGGGIFIYFDQGQRIVP